MAQAYHKNLIQNRESISLLSSCELQVVDSKYDVYVPQNNMEVEYALTIQKQQKELERYKNENLKLKKHISKLDADRDAIQETVNKYFEITNQQSREIAQLKERLEELENTNDDLRRIQKMKYFASNSLDLKEGLQNARYLNQNATEPRNKKPSTKNTAVTDLVNTDVKVTAETETKGLTRKHDLQLWSYFK